MRAPSRLDLDAVTCPSCKADVVPGARFCADCGQDLRLRGDERRIVTVLFADLVGFTSLSELRDPEQVKNLVDGQIVSQLFEPTAARIIDHMKSLGSS